MVTETDRQTDRDSQKEREIGTKKKDRQNEIGYKAKIYEWKAMKEALSPSATKLSETQQNQNRSLEKSNTAGI